MPSKINNDKQEAIDLLEKEYKKIIASVTRIVAKPESKSKKVMDKRALTCFRLYAQGIAILNQINLILSQPYAQKLPPLETIRD